MLISHPLNKFISSTTTMAMSRTESVEEVLTVTETTVEDNKDAKDKTENLEDMVKLLEQLRNGVTIVMLLMQKMYTGYNANFKKLLMSILTHHKKLTTMQKREATAAAKKLKNALKVAQKNEKPIRRKGGKKDVDYDETDISKLQKSEKKDDDEAQKKTMKRHHNNSSDHEKKTVKYQSVKSLDDNEEGEDGKKLLPKHQKRRCKNEDMIVNEKYTQTIGETPPQHPSANPRSGIVVQSSSALSSSSSSSSSSSNDSSVGIVKHQ
jgi:hypothetical protein